jgi:hypothetical protein
MEDGVGAGGKRGDAAGIVRAGYAIDGGRGQTSPTTSGIPSSPFSPSGAQRNDIER